MQYHRPLPSRELILSLFFLDEDAGILIHKERPREMFKTTGAWKTWNTRFANIPAGSVSRQGYLSVQIEGYFYFTHRIIYFLVYGEDPGDKVMDHIDENRVNNKPCNLRLATRTGNKHNIGKYRNNTSGHKNITWNKAEKAWRVVIGAEDRQYSLGSYKRLEEAIKVARQGREVLCGEFANHGDGSRELCCETKEDFLARVRTKRVKVKKVRKVKVLDSGVKGIYRNGKRWAVKITDKGKLHRFGSYVTLEEAIEALRKGRISLGLEK